MDAGRFIEPGGREIRPRSGTGTGSTTLPEDLLGEQSIRIQLFYAIGVALWLTNLVLDLYMSPHGDRGPHKLLIEGLGVALAAGTALFARCGRCSHRFKADAGVAFIVPHAFLLALLNSWAVQPTTARPISGITVLILLFGMLAPARPRSMLLAGLVAASMDPLGVWIAHLRGLPTPSIVNTLLMFYPNYACALLTVVPARLLYRLGRQIREARALGGYQLVERLGEGGMGEVWLGRHRLLARSAAIKLIRPEMLSDGSVDRAAVALGRFEREARATAAMTSPHTIRLFDFGQTHDGTFYYVMELLDGRDLESLVHEFGPLPPGRVMHFVRQICRSLAEAHARGLVHRDIKPANIYVCRVGLEYDFVKVLDFGLVKHANGSTAATQLTAETVAMGTGIHGARSHPRRGSRSSRRCVRTGLSHVLPAHRQDRVRRGHPDEAAHAARAAGSNSTIEAIQTGDPAGDRRSRDGVPAQGPQSPAARRQRTSAPRVINRQRLGPSRGAELVGDSPSRSICPLDARASRLARQRTSCRRPVTGARDSGWGLGPVHSETDLAVIKVDGRNLPVLPFADSDQSIRLAC